MHALRGQMARLREDLPDAVRNTLPRSIVASGPSGGAAFGIELQMNLVEIYKGMHDEAASHRHLEIAQSEISALDEQGPSRPEFFRLRALIRMNAGDLRAPKRT